MYRLRYHPRLALTLCVLLQHFCAYIETRRVAFPENIMQVHHATGRRPFEYANVTAGAEVWHRDCLQAKFKTHSAVPGHKERVLIHQLSAFAIGEDFVIMDTFNLRYGADDVVPIISLRSKRSEETWYITQLRGSMCVRCTSAISSFHPGLDFDLVSHGKQ